MMLAGLFATGMLLFEPFSSLVPEDALLSWRHPSAVVHGVLAAWSLVVLGAVLARHMLPMWRANRVRWSGVALALLWALLALSGQVAQYGDDGPVRTFIVAGHGWLGCGLVLPVVLHMWRRRAVRLVP